MLSQLHLRSSLSALFTLSLRVELSIDRMPKRLQDEMQSRESESVSVQKVYGQACGQRRTKK